MSNVTFTLQVRASKLDQKFASNGSKIDQKSVPNRSRKRVCFEVAFQIDFGRLPGRFWDQFWVRNGRSFAVEMGLGSGPGPKLDSKGRLDPTSDHSGSILEAFLKNLL